MEKNVLVSIITVSYNSEKTISKTIESVLNQTYKKIEYIIIDGSSTDSTVDIIRSYENKFGEKKIKYKWISEKDKGIYDAMNKGIKLAKGLIIGIINSDDYYFPNTIERVVEAFENTKADIVHGDVQVIYDSVEEIFIRKSSEKFLYRKMSINHPATFVKKEVYERYGFFDEHFEIAGDYELILRFKVNNLKFFYLNETLTVFKAGGASYRNLNKNMKEVYLIQKKYFNTISATKNLVIKKLDYSIKNVFKKLFGEKFYYKMKRLLK
ncbi:hypothetical protein XO12_05855 [Marinitoga sp. 1154]|uniref:glycosyltransferase family 2 protein n=1 Tax=Marinitoga sp. 1154 TaxID=1643335 RepID=UPI00158646E8|nr:glycosyltransferase family 2 protein [Marinitoga sp. 1154]NUU99640.1 hypothetical protein [Marinitoga sp. 1154]